MGENHFGVRPIEDDRKKYTNKAREITMKRTGLFYFFILFGTCLFAQDAALRQTLDAPAADYLKTIGNASVLYYGNPQEDLPRASNHPFLQESQYTRARLSYLGVHYPDVMLRLDLRRHELVILSPDARHIVLLPDNVDEAELHGRRVVYESGEASGSLSKGYYYLLHAGACQVLEKQTASLNRKENSANNLEEYYILATRFFLYKDGAYQTIRSKGGLLKALEPHKKELKRFISSNHLSYRKHQEDFLVMTVAEYERLSEL